MMSVAPKVRVTFGESIPEVAVPNGDCIYEIIYT
jgi:hypothetical protein